MSLQLLIDGNDFTAAWKIEESRWTSRAWQGESSVSEFVLEDPDGTLNHNQIKARKVVEVWEDASGSSVCMYRGRVGNKLLGMGPGNERTAMRWRVQTEDYNVDARGIRVKNAVYDAMTDEERVEAIRLAFLNGAASTHPEARDSTDLGNTYIGSGDPVDLPEERYTDTYPYDVLARITETSGRLWFVFVDDAGDGQLYYGSMTAEDYLSDITISDDGSAESYGPGVTSIDIFAPAKGPDAGEHQGQYVLSGAGIRFGSGLYEEDSDIDGREAEYDKWEEHITNEFVEHTFQAAGIVNKTVGLRDEDFTYIAVLDMRAEDAHRLKAGMMVTTIRERANKTVAGYQRAVQVTHEPLHPDENGNAWYRVTAELGRPRGRTAIPGSRRRPKYLPIPSTATCTRLYFSNTPGSAITEDAAWDDVGGSVGTFLLLTSPDDSLASSNQSTWDEINYASGRDVLLAQGAYELSAGDLLDAIQAGSATISGQVRGRARHGIGVDESTQDHISQVGVRVWRSGVGIVGTAKALHSIASSAGSSKWPAQSPLVNRSVVPGAGTGTLSAVAGAQAGDFLVVEVGVRHFGPTSGATGGALAATNDNATDLPEDEIETTAFNSWIEFCSGSSGDSPPGTVLPGQEAYGDGLDDDGNLHFVPVGTTYPHGFLADDGIHFHDANQNAYDNADSELTAEDVQAAIDELDGRVDVLEGSPTDLWNTPVSANVSNPPTQSELETAIGATPDENSGQFWPLTDTTNSYPYVVTSDGSQYWYIPFIKAVGTAGGGVGEPGGADTPDTLKDLADSPFGGWEKTKVIARAYNGETLWSYIRGDNGDIGVLVRKHSDGSTTSALIGTAYQIDDHASPDVLIRESDHRVITVSSKHNGPTITQKISNSGGTSLTTSIASGFTYTNLDSQLGGDQYTYPNIVQLTGETDDPLYLFVRGEAGGSGQAWHWAKSTNGGGSGATPTWTTLEAWMQIGGRTPYPVIRRTSTTRIDFLVADGHWTTETDIDIYHVYYDGSDQTWHETDGTEVTPTLGRGQMTQVFDGTGLETRAQDVVLGADGHPRVVFVKKVSDTDFRYMFSRWDGSAWTAAVEVSADAEMTSGGSNATGGITFDRADDGDTVYYSKEVSGVMEMFVAVTADDGDTWTPSAITTTSAADQFNPVGVDDKDTDLSVVWQDGEHNDYTDWLSASRGY